MNAISKSLLLAGWSRRRDWWRAAPGRSLTIEQSLLFSISSPSAAPLPAAPCVLALLHRWRRARWLVGARCRALTRPSPRTHHIANYIWLCCSFHSTPALTPLVSKPNAESAGIVHVSEQACAGVCVSTKVNGALLASVSLQKVFLPRLS